MVKLVLLVLLASFANIYGDVLPVGTVSTPYGTVSDCPTGFACKYINVTSPSLPCYAVARIAIAEPVTAVATDVLFSGSSGGAWWTGGLYSGATFVQDLLNAGHRVVQISWDYTGGTQKRDCPSPIYPIVGASRPAAVIKYAHDRWPGTLNVLGGSAGSSQISYALAFYGAEQWITGVAILASTNPMMEIDKGCGTGYPAYAYDSVGISILNNFFSGSGCGTGGNDPNWATNSVEYGGNYSYQIPVKLFYGAVDQGYIIIRAHDYHSLLSPGTPDLSITSVPGTGHSFAAYPIAVNQYLLPALIGNLSPTPAPTATTTISPLPTPTATCICP